MVPNFVMKVDHTLQLRPRKIWAKYVEFQTTNGSLKFENRHHTPVCDLVKTGV